MLFSLALIATAALIIISLVRGAPYVPILRRDSDAVLALAKLKSGQTIIDLGSGDGRFLRAAAARGIHGIGYEINPLLVVISRVVCWRYRKLVTIHLADFWLVKLPQSDVIYTFLLDHYMTRLDTKLQKEVVQPTLLVSFVFQIPSRQSLRHNHNTYVYQYPHATD